MDESPEPLESIWEGLLSRRPEQVREAFAGLSGEEQAAVLVHLRRMANEAGWHSEQRESAQAALEAINV